MSDVIEQKKPDWKDELRKVLKSNSAKKTYAVLGALVVLRLGVNLWLNRAAVIGVPVVKVEQPALKNVDRTLSLPGNVEAIEQATLYAHVSGYLKTIKVDEGDKVKKNQVLAIVDAPDVLQEYRNAKAEYDFKEVTRKRYGELLKEKVISQQEYDKVEAEANQSKARFDNADSNLQYTSVRAPFAGAIARRFKYPGDFISAPTKGGTASPLFMLVNESRLRVVVNAPQREVANISVGHAVDVQIDSFQGHLFHGVISRVDAILDEATKTQRALIDIENPSEQMRAGMFVSVVLHVERKNGVSMVSHDALHEDGGKSYVLVVRDGKVKKLIVTPGFTEGSFVELNGGGLDSKDQVVVSGGMALRDGDVVKIAEETDPNPQQANTKEMPRKIAEEAKN